MYKEYCDDSLIEYKLARYKFREELKNYFETFHKITRVNGRQIRSYYSGFLSDKFKNIIPVKEEPFRLVIEENTSLLDNIAEGYSLICNSERNTL